MGNSQNKIFDAKMRAKEWQWELKQEVKGLDKQIKSIQQSEAKLRKEIEASAAKGQVDSVQLMARSIVKSRKAVNRLERTKASMHAVNLQIETSMATMSTTGSLKISADVLARMNKICNVEGVSKNMEAMKKEMQRCQDAEDLVEATFMDSDEEDEAATEMKKVLDEMALGHMAVLASTTAGISQEAAPMDVSPEVAPPAKAKALAAPMGASSASAAAPPAAPPAAPAAPPAAPTGAPMGGTSAQAFSPPPASAPPPSTIVGDPNAAAPPAAPPAAGPVGGAPPEDDLLARLAALKK